MKGLLIEAGAGCGKTYTIVSRYIRALGYDPDTGKSLPGGTSLYPHQIWLLTFTEDAAAEMLDRILLRLDTLGLHPLKEEVLESSIIGTIHSLCYRLLRPMLGQMGYDPKQKILSAPLAQTLRARHLIRSLAQFEDRHELFHAFDSHSLIRLGLSLWFEESLGATEAMTEHFRRMSDQLLETESQIVAATREAYLRYSVDPKLKLAWLERASQAFAQSDRLSRRQAIADLSFVGGSKILKDENAALYRKLQAMRDFYGARYDLVFDPDFHRLEVQTLEALKRYLNFAKTDAPKLLDFEALEKELLRQLANGGSVGQRSPRLLILDEAQDTSRAQFDILRRLSDEATEFLVVGDPKQSIYGFRGAEVQVFYKFKTELQREVLGTSRRSDAELLSFQNAFQRALFEAHLSENDPEPQELLAWDVLSQQRSPLRAHVPTRILWNHDAPSASESILAEFERRQKTSTLPATHAVLFFRWRDIFEFSELCRERGVPFVVSGEGILESHHLTQIFSSYLKKILAPESRDFDFALQRFAGGAEVNGPGLSPPLTQSSLNEIFACFCARLQPERWSLGKLWTAAMERFLGDFTKQELGFETEVEDLFRVLESGRDLTTELPELDVSRLPTDCLILSTLHASKGLEYDFVYLPEMPGQGKQRSAHAIDDDWGLTSAHPLRFASLKVPTFQSIVPRHRKSWRDFAEKKRLLYVAITRAKRGLSLFPLLKKGAGNQKNSALSLLGLESPPSQSLGLWLDAARPYLNNKGLSYEELLPPGAAPESALPATVAPPAEIWNWPRPVVPDTARPYRSRMMGVSRYLQEKSPPAFTTTSASTAGRDFQELGNHLHRLMEVWNGEKTSLDVLVKDFPLPHRDPLHRAAIELRQLPELGGYFADLRAHPERIYRELPLMKMQGDCALFGICDSLWMPTPAQAVLIDWKGSHSLQTLRSAERLEKILKQLGLYAEAFRSQFENLTLLAIGIDLGSAQPRAEVLFEEVMGHSSAPAKSPAIDFAAIDFSDKGS